ncbi:replication initiation protein [Clostridium tarantellae]|uniref:RepB family plasmid replication initiator protein n=1 Tax=Clostridium tarantellae TaxID=39493 RepID=A0A6I1MR68_9CLOT|nr:replication initiation protein [Clostridium tarantellae]MPQ44712.1 RepB family plasmid replication initiator protein [Clostridium tarantellae]
MTYLKNNLVSKSNELIEKSYFIPTKEQKLLLLAISMIDSTKDDECGKVTFDLKEIIELLELNPRNCFSDLTRITKSLLSRVVELKTKDGNLRQFQWLSECYYENGKVEMLIHQRLYPYLLHLKEHFTKYKLENVLKLNSKYSIRIYELMKRFEFQNEFKIDLEEFTYILKCPEYKLWSQIKVNIIDPSLKEINIKTDINVIYESIKTGRKVTSLQFNIKHKKNKVSTSAENFNFEKNEIDKLNKLYGVDKVTECIELMKLKNKKINNNLNYLKGMLENKTITQPQKILNFTNYNQREYDYDSLEKQLLGWDD